MRTDPERPPRRHDRADRTRSALVTAALSLFAERGVEDTAVDDITGAANVAKGTFYVHFRRKQDVLLEHAASLIDAVGAAELPDSTPEAVEALCQRLAAAFAATPPSVGRPMARQLLCDPLAWARVAGPRRTLSGLVGRVVSQGQASGELRGDQTAEALSRRLAALWLDALSAAAPDSTDRGLLDALRGAASVFLEGATARAAGGPGRVSPNR